MFHCWCFISNASHRFLGDKSPLVLSDCVLSLSLLHWGRRPRPLLCLVFPVRLLYLQTSVGKVPVVCAHVYEPASVSHTNSLVASTCPCAEQEAHHPGKGGQWCRQGSQLCLLLLDGFLRHSAGVITKTGPLAHLVWLMSYK